MFHILAYANVDQTMPLWFTSRSLNLTTKACLLNRIYPAPGVPEHEPITVIFGVVWVNIEMQCTLEVLAQAVIDLSLLKATTNAYRSTVPNYGCRG